MVAWMWSGETCWRAWAMAGSTGAGAMGWPVGRGCWAFREGARRAAAVRRVRRARALVRVVKTFSFYGTKRV
jgi:hypothetical protein